MKLPKLSRKLRNLSALFLLLTVVAFILYNFGTTIDSLNALLKSPPIGVLRTTQTMSVPHISSFWGDSTNDLGHIPSDVRIRAEELTIAEKTVRVDGVKIFYRESLESVESKITLLLLHGKSFSSRIWLDLTTIALFTAAGYRTIAIDLPGFGNSDKLPANGEGDKSTFLLHLITKLDISKPVIVSPSYSGYYTLPLLVKNWNLFTGYVPVAPVGQEVIESLKSCHHPDTATDNQSIMNERFNRLPDYFKEQVKNKLPDVSCIKTPALVIYGELDRSKSSALLSLLPNAKPFEIPLGKHPCYLQNPNLFHAVIYDFMLRLVEVEGRLH